MKLYSLNVESPVAVMNYKHTWPSPDGVDFVRQSNLVKFQLQYSTYASGKDTLPKYEIAAVMDYTIPNQFDAACGIILVTIVIIILVSFSASFQSQVEVLVVAPLEKMLNTLRSSATVMLKSMNAIDKEAAADAEDEDSDDGGKYRPCGMCVYVMSCVFYLAANLPCPALPYFTLPTPLPPSQKWKP
jgi:hypothetical protein